MSANEVLVEFASRFRDGHLDRWYKRFIVTPSGRSYPYQRNVLGESIEDAMKESEKGGDDMADWLQAERELLERVRKIVAGKATHRTSSPTPLTTRG